MFMASVSVMEQYVGTEAASSQFNEWMQTLKLNFEVQQSMVQFLEIMHHLQ
jgi:hypothetical protein